MDTKKGEPMSVIVHDHPVKATIPPVSPETVAWAAHRLAEIGFKPSDVRYFGLPAYSAYELETAMGAIGMVAGLEASPSCLP